MNNNGEILKTPFYQYHIDADAKMATFAGFYMPIQYKGITSEHMAVRENIGLFDLSHMGEFEVTGTDALAFLEKTTTNNVASLTPGQIQYSCMPTPKGGIVDDLLIYYLEKDKYFLVVNASNISKDFKWLDSQKSGDVKLIDRSADFGLLATQGPNAQKLMAKLTDYDLEKMGYYTHATANVAGEWGTKSMTSAPPPAQRRSSAATIFQSGFSKQMPLRTQLKIPKAKNRKTSKCFWMAK